MLALTRTAQTLLWQNKKRVLELVQSVLRISPVPGFAEDNIKLVVFGSTPPALPYIGDRYVGEVNTEFLAKNLIAFLTKIKTEVLLPESGETKEFYGTRFGGRTIYYMFRPKINSEDIGVILFYYALKSSNPKIFKGLFLLGIKPEDLGLWYRHIEGFEFTKWKNLRDELSKVVHGARRDEKIRWFIRLLKELDAFDEVGSGVNLRTGRHYRILKVKKFDKLKKEYCFILV